MNRRQFLGASFAAAIASLMLPFERFAEWCKAWLGYDRRRAFLDAKAREIDALYERMGEQLSQTIWGGDVANFEVGERMAIHWADDIGGRATSEATITAVDRHAGTITFDTVLA